MKRAFPLLVAALAVWFSLSMDPTPQRAMQKVDFSEITEVAFVIPEGTKCYATASARATEADPMLFELSDKRPGGAITFYECKSKPDTSGIGLTFQVQRLPNLEIQVSSELERSVLPETCPPFSDYLDCPSFPTEKIGGGGITTHRPGGSVLLIGRLSSDDMPANFSIDGTRMTVVLDIEKLNNSRTQITVF